MTYAPGVDVVVTNYRTPGDLYTFMETLGQEAGTVPYSATVVNICPRPDDQLVAAAANKAGAAVVEYQHNVGYAVACNKGATLGNHDVIALFNADIQFEKDALTKCYEALMANPDWGMLGPRQVDEDFRMTHAGIFGTNDAPRHRGWKEPDQRAFMDVAEAFMVAGSACFIKREVWDEMRDCPIYQLVDPTSLGAMLQTPFYYEDAWLASHVREHGWKVIYYGPVRIVHTWHASVRQNDVENWAKQQYRISQKIFADACDAHGILREPWTWS